MEREVEAVISSCFGAVAPLADLGSAALEAAVRVAAGTIFAVVAPLALVSAAGLTLLFTVVLPGLAIAFVDVLEVFVAGFWDFATVFAGLATTAIVADWVAGLAAVLPLGGAAVFAGVLLTLFAAVLLMADLVTVAFIVPSLL